MLDSVPGSLLAILWPLAGAAVILVLGRLLPNWMRRLLASACALLSLAALWSLRGGAGEPVGLYWQPINLFRTSPALNPDALAVMVGLILSGITAATVLGIRGSNGRPTPWPGLMLLALAGCLVAMMAANLLTVLLGSALLDLALIAMTLSARDGSGRVFERFVVPGVLSTVVLFFGAMQMDILTGSASLSARTFPPVVLLLLAVAGLLRLLPFPIHPRGLNTPQAAATLLLPLGLGAYLLSRVQALAPVLAEHSWVLTIGGAGLLAGGFLAWMGGIRRRADQGYQAGQSGFDWPGAAVHQTGYVLLFVALLGPAVPWALLSLTLTLGLLAIWWDAGLQSEASASLGEPGLSRRFGPLRERAQRLIAERAPFLERWRSSWFARYGATLAAILALLSLAGVPLTAGSIGRWSFYATLLHQRQSALLLVTLLADTLLTAALWLALAETLDRSAARRPGLGGLGSTAVLALLVIVLGVAPNSLIQQVGLNPLTPPDVSVWGLGLIFVLPWLLAGWLARVSSHLEGYALVARQVVDLNWLYAAGSWAGRQVMAAVGWLGQVGEGEGWWGWALIILALGSMALILR